MQPNSNSLRDKLRTATGPFHLAVENKMDLLNESITLDRYQQILIQFYRFYKSFEDYLRTLPPNAATQFYLKNRTKLESLIQDLGEHDYGSVALPHLENEAQIWGALYVIEGSSLGGQLLKKFFSKKFPELPHHFFAGYGPNTGPMWQGFLAELSRLEEELGDEVVKGAIKTFESFLSWRP